MPAISKKRKSQQRNRNDFLKKSQKEVLELKTTIYEILLTSKNHLMALEAE